MTRQSVQFPLHVLPTNRTLGEHPFARARRVRSHREIVRRELDRNLVVPPLVVDGSDNAIEVEMVRLSPGTVDDDVLPVCLKHVRDEIADWLDLDDRDERVRFRPLQQQCEPGYHAVRITISDRSHGASLARVVGPAPGRLGVVTDHSSRGAVGGGGHGPGLPPKPKPKPKRSKQEALRFTPCWAMLPWDGEGVATELTTVRDEVGHAPTSIAVLVPDGALEATLRTHRASVRRRLDGRHEIMLHKHAEQDQELGGNIWTYWPHPCALCANIRRPTPP
jgi:hypothetical protein